MTSTLVYAASLALVVIVLLSILGAVEHRERYGFVGGILLFILAHAAVTSPESVATGLAVLGILVATASTMPLLRQSV